VKRIDAVIGVFARIRRAKPAVLILVGDGPDLTTGLTLAREMGIAEDVRAIGEQGDVRALLSIANLFLLPSAQESFGLAALEAMACEVPVVASRVGGLPEVIEDGVSGFLRAPEDLDGMAEIGIDLLTDPALAKRIGLAGRDHVRQRYCSDRIVPRYEAYYEEVLTRPERAEGGPAEESNGAVADRVEIESGADGMVGGNRREDKKRGG
jgi:N-acetyl-alpha-D-glucosaminyl L-malate synthase BshA